MRQEKIVFIVANRHTNAGQYDYCKATADAIQNGKKRDNVDYLFYRIPESGASVVGADARRLPLTNDDFDLIPVLDGETISAIAAGSPSKVSVVGLGQDTLDALAKVAYGLRDRNVKTEASYLTHAIKGSTDLGRVVDMNALILAPIDQASLSKIDADLGPKARLVSIESVPHTNSEALCRIEYDRFMKSPNGHRLSSLIARGDEFAFVGLNAGFTVETSDGGKEWAPYTAHEARTHGSALGWKMASGTHLFLAHGGPRNLQDFEDTTAAFLEGYEEAQSAKGAHVEILVEPYRRDGKYNPMKAGFILARETAQLKAFICPVEGYDALAAARYYVNNVTTALGMFPSHALRRDLSGQRIKNTEAWFNRGISMMYIDKKGAFTEMRPKDAMTPVAYENKGLVQVMERLRLTEVSPLSLLPPALRKPPEGGRKPGA
jgi:hypothetical protein